MEKLLATKKSCALLMNQLQLPDEFKYTINEIYFPLVEIMVNKKTSSPLLVSLNGVQGSGKSTLTSFVKKIIENQYAYKVVEFSIDDFYLTRSERHKLSLDVHPLLSTRGVPGTHDISYLENILDALLNRGLCCIPRFNKSIDDRCPDDQWTVIDKPVDIILFEGWCNNSPVQTQSELVKPVNLLEKIEDSDRIWRHYVNDCLYDYHKRIFQYTDMTIMLKPNSFERVYAWRRLQEEKLQQRLRCENKPVSNKTGVMDDVALSRFIQHYERISRHTLLHFPKLADVVLPLDDYHFISAMIQKSP